MEKLNYKKLVRKAADVIDDKKGENIVIFDVRKMTAFTDYIMIASVNSGVQMQAVIKEFSKNFDIKPGHIEGASGDEWVLLDFNGFIVNLFTPEMREFYGLERIWGEAERLSKKNVRN